MSTIKCIGEQRISLYTAMKHSPGHNIKLKKTRKKKRTYLLSLPKKGERIQICMYLYFKKTM